MHIFFKKKKKKKGSPPRIVAFLNCEMLCNQKMQRFLVVIHPFSRKYEHNSTNSATIFFYYLFIFSRFLHRKQQATTKNIVIQVLIDILSSYLKLFYASNLKGAKNNRPIKIYSNSCNKYIIYWYEKMLY